ncbi:MAG: right-handed parallel beta-helix repeat-containing protein [Calditrichaeota bacterium]|jgi:parallel beta-helix repeat protein|nr:right-handed parallel beta-helix repeat-containing protein [Calditrichota bacterium]MBT7618235.1 right-handed parallel beta-helix repeat-containing protein [Calditrichota bacterium]MBT7787522.1 right-handed parallel beta-helix repeat-containing protein [Calditrichota bacterium]
MQRLLSFLLIVTIIFVVGCEDLGPVSSYEYRGNPIEGVQTGVLTLDGSPYLVTDTLRIPAGQTLTIEAGVEIRFDTIIEDEIEKTIPFEIRGKIIANGLPEAPIVFTSGLTYPSRGDWDGIWLLEADDESSFEYCEFLFGARYGNRYLHNPDIYGFAPDSVEWEYSGTDSVLWDYGSITLHKTSPTIKRCTFWAGGFSGIHCGTEANPVVENCVFYDNAGHGIYVHNTAKPEVRYNIISENDDYGVFFRQLPNVLDPRMDDVNLDYNIVWSNFSGEFNQTSPVGFGRITIRNANLDSCDFRYNLRLNPAFKDPIIGDFLLTAESAAIDAGPPIDGDIDKTARIELGIWPYIYRPGEIRRIIEVDRFEKSLSPYYITSNTTLPLGNTLTIEAGVEILVEGLYQLRADGRIISEGTESNPVKFTSAFENPRPGSWVGLIFNAGGDNGSILRHTSISFARWGLSLSERDAKIDYCTITQSDSIGILCDNFSAPEITNSLFTNNAVAAIQCQNNSSAIIRGNRISGGAGYGIYAKGSSRPIIENNVIENVNVVGVRLENLSGIRVINNTFSRNGYYGLYCLNNSSPLVQNNIFFENGDELRGGIGLVAERSSDPGILYNCFYGHLKNPVSVSDDTNLDIDINLVAAPQFSDLDTGDYELEAGSPCVGYGRNPDDPNDNTPFDLGAHGVPPRDLNQ